MREHSVTSFCTAGQCTSPSSPSLVPTALLSDPPSFSRVVECPSSLATVSASCSSSPSACATRPFSVHATARAVVSMAWNPSVASCGCVRACVVRRKRESPGDERDERRLGPAGGDRAVAGGGRRRRCAGARESARAMHRALAGGCRPATARSCGRSPPAACVWRVLGCERAVGVMQRARVCRVCWLRTA